MAKKHKPKTPEQIAADKLARRQADFEAVNLQPEAAGLERNANIEARHAQREKIDGARRADAFDALKPGMAPGAYDAVRRLEMDMAIRRGEGDKGRPMMRVDGGGSDGLDKRLAAGDRIKAALGGIGDRDAWLLVELIEKQLMQVPWREVVFRVTGETHDHAQGAAVRSACANLAASYDHRQAA